MLVGEIVHLFGNGEPASQEGTKMNDDIPTPPRPRDPFLKPDEAARRLARRLLSEARHGALASVFMPEAQPLATRVALSTLPSGDVVLLLSDLAEHSRALATHPAASLLVGEPGGADALTQPRLTLRGHVERLAEGPECDAARSRYLARLPQASAYAGFADFAFYRLGIEDALLNAGFARAYRLTRDDLCRAVPPELAGREAAVIAHMNEDHADSLAKIVAFQQGTVPRDWRILTLDPLGFEAGSGEDLVRIEFAQAVTSGDGYRQAFVSLARESEG